ncbi:MAG: 3-deoxy-manno-octulosonate cytidylyltransferase [Thermodesulfobacteriota bacterium]
MSTAIAIIPARMGSSRFPGKPLAPIAGVPMVGHVWKRVCLALGPERTFVATCDQVIADYVAAIGGRAVMTADTHERCSDRCAEAMLAIEKDLGRSDLVVMVQGDEPLVTPRMVSEAVAPFAAEPDLQVVNLMAPLHSREEQDDPNEVKVVVDLADNALYFSREPIPSWRKGARDLAMYKQVCIIPFRRDFLLKFNSLVPTPLEVAESVDMLRVLEHGLKVRMVRTAARTVSVDTPQDLAAAEALMAGDALFASYRDELVGIES